MSKRKPTVAGNWKMNLNRAGAVALAREVASGIESLAGAVDVAVCPPYVYLDAVSATLANTPVTVGAQDTYFQKNGAFTGEISVEMLVDVGARCVIIGHSERRHLLGEDESVTQQKTRAVLDAGLECILCVGEKIGQRLEGATNAVNERQLRSALTGVPVSLASKLTIAYEPVWAIGTGQTATPQDAQNAHAHIRTVLASIFSPEASQGIRIQYGGSVKPENAKELFGQPDIDGGLIGGASLKASDFLAIIRAAV